MTDDHRRKVHFYLREEVRAWIIGLVLCGLVFGAMLIL